MKVITILGARPQFVKAAMVSNIIRHYGELNEVIIHTGQHFDDQMSGIFFTDMNIPRSKYNLGIHSLSHAAMTGRQLERIEEILLEEKPDYVLVYGDTNSTLAGALAGAKLNIPVVHIEAGLRSFNKKMPEEINRVLTDHLSELLFVPTTSAVNNLESEGIQQDRIHLVGDVMYDAVLHFSHLAENSSTILSDLGLIDKEYILATVHRQGNTDSLKKLQNIFSSFSECSLPVVIPLHPRTKKKIEELDIHINGSVQIVEPVGYLDMLILEKNANKIATDSGGVQKEAYFFHVPCITLRDETEWIELVEIGANQIVGTDRGKITKALNGDVPAFSSSLDFGEGKTANKIVEIMYKNEIK